MGKMNKLRKIIKKVRSHLKKNKRAYQLEIKHNKEEISEDKELREDMNKDLKKMIGRKGEKKDGKIQVRRKKG